MKSVVISVSNENVKEHWKNTLESDYTIEEIQSVEKRYVDPIMFHFVEENFADLEKLANAQNRVMVFSSSPSFDEGYKLLPLGIKAYANAMILPQTLKEIVSVVERGDAWLYPEFINQMILNVSNVTAMKKGEDILKKLSEREAQIALYVAQGLSNKVIAENADITERTVKAHLSSIFHKLAIKDRLALALLING